MAQRVEAGLETSVVGRAFPILSYTIDNGLLHTPILVAVNSPVGYSPPVGQRHVGI